MVSPADHSTTCRLVMHADVKTLHVFFYVGDLAPVFPKHSTLAAGQQPRPKQNTRQFAGRNRYTPTKISLPVMMPAREEHIRYGACDAVPRMCCQCAVVPDQYHDS